MKLNLDCAFGVHGQFVSDMPIMSMLKDSMASSSVGILKPFVCTPCTFWYAMRIIPSESVRLGRGSPEGAMLVPVCGG